MPTFEIKNPIIVDTETYYDRKTFCSVRSDKKRGWVGGNYHYVHHKDFYCYIISYLDPTTGEKGVCDDRSKFPELISRFQGRTFVGLNVGFDISVLRSVVPDFEPLNSFDVGDMAQYLQYPRSLDQAALFMLGITVNKGLRDFMESKHYREIGAEKQRQVLDYALGDAEVTAQLFLKYKDQWPQLEAWLSDFNRKQNDAGVHIDTNYLEEQTDRVLKARSKAVSLIPWVEDVDVDKPQSAKKLAVWCREAGIPAPASLAEDSEECQLWESIYGDDFPVVGAIRDYRKTNTYYKKLDLIQQLLRPDNTIPFDTKYCAAPHTARFSAQRFNYQSLPRSSEYCDIRGCLIPPPGQSFVGADLSGIEARCLPYLAGDVDYLSQVAQLDAAATAQDRTGGGDIYEPAARKLFGHPESKALKEDKPLRHATKTCVLQLGYQAGRKKFNWYVGNNVDKPTLDRVRQGEETDEELTARLVKLYRASNPKIQNLWYGLDRELRSACTMGVPYKVQLPSGRVIQYFDLALRDSVDVNGQHRMEVVGAVCRGGELKKLYGGKITENISQGMARDVLVTGIYNLASKGFATRMSIHDENVIPVGRDEANRDTCREIERTMATTPDWAPGLPLAAETSIMERYSK